MRVAMLVCAAACVLALGLRPAAAGALVCNHRYCQQHPCTSPVPASSCRAPSVYRAEHSGKCGCCPACVTLLGKGEACKAYSKELGATPGAVCRDGLRCVSGKCEQLARG